ncbi:MAG: hypothetical protein ACREDF_05630, partial [Thermoplasmata archaeon]
PVTRRRRSRPSADPERDRTSTASTDGRKVSVVSERRGGARYQVPNLKEVTPTKLWTLAVLAVSLVWVARFSVTALRYAMRF